MKKPKGATSLRVTPAVISSTTTKTVHSDAGKSETSKAPSQPDNEALESTRRLDLVVPVPPKSNLP